MPVFLHPRRHRRLSDEERADWQALRAPIISDSMNRARTMAAAIKPVGPGMRLLGQALTVRTIAADITPLLYALEVAEPGDVLVVDAAQHVDNAVLGGHMNNEALRRGLVGIVIDGSVRDVEELRSSGMPVFSRGVTPAGPHSGLIGDVNLSISCGGVTVDPGDIVVGDDDGVVVVPLDRARDVLQRCREHLEIEADWARRIADGEGFARILDLPPPEDAP